MRKVVKHERRGPNHYLHIIDSDREGHLIIHALTEGLLEAYMGAYGMPAGVTLQVMIADAIEDDLELAPFGSPEAEATIGELLNAAKKLVWEIDRDEVLTAITLADDTAEMVKNSWAIQAAAALKSLEEPLPTTNEWYQKVAHEQPKKIADGHQRRQEELLAEEFVSAMKENDIGTASSGGGIPMEFVNGRPRIKE